jgi:predicted RNA methylase
MKTLRRQRNAIGSDLRHLLRTFGAPAILAYAFDRIRVALAERGEGFDKRFGTDTEGKMYHWQLGMTAEGEYESNPYEAAPAWLIHKILAELPIDADEFVFVDIGSGKGRALMVASEFGFSKIVGVEMSAVLCETASRNLDRYLASRGKTSRYAICCANASDYVFGAEPAVVFLFNPFGERTFRAMLSNLERSLERYSRPVYVVYLNPRYDRVLNGSEHFLRICISGCPLMPWRQYAVYLSVSYRTH